MVLQRLFFISILCIVVCDARKPRIYGGYDIDISEVPYQVFILIEFDGGQYSYCGGVIFDKRYIFTAGHCLADTQTAKVTSITVRSGSNYANSGGEATTGEGYVIHPMFYKTMGNDFDYGFVKLSSDLKFNANQSAAKLPSPNEVIGSGHEFIIAGWGATEPGLPIPIHLRAVKLPKVNKDRCEDLYAKEGIKLTHRDMCVGYANPKANNETHTGLGDSGTPAVSTTYNTVHGVVAFQNDLQPTVLSKVANTIDWITEVMAGNVPLKPLKGNK